MACDYSKLNEEQMDDIINRYIHHKMSEDEEIEFASHLVECESCNEKVNKMRNLTVNAKLYFVHEQLETALKDKDLDKAIDLAAEMEVLGYSEEVYPINEKIINLKNELINITYNDLVSSSKKSNWERVIELGNELDRLGAREDLCPRRRIIGKAALIIEGQMEIDTIIRTSKDFDLKFLDKLPKSEKEDRLSMLFEKYNVKSIDELRKVLNSKGQ